MSLFMKWVTARQRTAQRPVTPRARSAKVPGSAACLASTSHLGISWGGLTDGGG